ncbi:MAG: hypothetical protein ACE5NP_00800 [Anaerolineae bacterium]
MTTGQKLLIAIGSFVLVTIIAIAAFSLGVYVGEHGWTRKGLTFGGPGQMPPPEGPAGGPGQPGAPPPAPGLDHFGGGPPQVIGQVQSVTDTSITVRTPQGPRTVTVDEDTTVEKTEGGEADLSDIRRGTAIAVFGELSHDGRTLAAQHILILPPPPR